MGIKVIRKFNQREIESLVDQIYPLIHDDVQLTIRDKDIIRTWLSSQELFCAFEKGKLLGFIAAEHMYNNYYELKSWYVIAERRGKEVGEKLFVAAIKDRTKTYIGVTFQKEIIDRLYGYGFKKIAIYKLPIKLAYRYISSRRLTSIIKHLFKKRSTLLILRQRDE